MGQQDIRLVLCETAPPKIQRRSHRALALTPPEERLSYLEKYL